MAISLLKKIVMLQFDCENRNVKIYDCRNVKSMKHLAKECCNIKIYDLDNISEIKTYIKGKKLIVIYESEEAYIRLLKIPRVNKSSLELLINNELTYIFKDVNEICYTYEVLNTKGKEMNVLVFCINTDKNRMLEMYFNENKIKGVFLIQSFYVQYMLNRIKTDTFICVFLYGTDLYLIGCIKSKMVYNSIIRKFDGNRNSFMSRFRNAEEKFAEFQQSNDIAVHFINFDYLALVEEISENYIFSNHGRIEENIIINNLISWRHI